jgi:hypothetical protein
MTRIVTTTYRYKRPPGKRRSLIAAILAGLIAVPALPQDTVPPTEAQVLRPIRQDAQGMLAPFSNQEDGRAKSLGSRRSFTWCGNGTGRSDAQ